MSLSFLLLQGCVIIVCNVQSQAKHKLRHSFRSLHDPRLMQGQLIIRPHAPYILHVSCYMAHVTPYMLHASYNMSHVITNMLHLSHATCFNQMLHVIHYVTKQFSTKETFCFLIHAWYIIHACYMEHGTCSMVYGMSILDKP